ncbi:DUF192 domain-containing protein [Mobiluncus porci]|uniref:DUF192 domain-containing protein n=1 Tax=Mobiluncus porci TaxID=2652278 RepID=A0A7K0K0D8_9ACTO|nr:DUF192 domain-containing protein [Mobiluncus porci]MST48953.1 DUF192 domain-containing protein [Mobiluncus porci]
METTAGPVWADLRHPDFWAGKPLRKDGRETVSAARKGTNPAATGGASSGGKLPVFVAGSRRTRNQGLLKTWSTPGIVWITKCNSIHTVAMHFTIDVAYLDRDQRVLEIVRYRPGRVGRPRFRARSVLEAEPGIFEEFGIIPGTVFSPHPATAASPTESVPTDAPLPAAS